MSDDSMIVLCSFISRSFFVQGKESEIALFASLKRERNKDEIIKALTAGKQTAEKLV